MAYTPGVAAPCQEIARDPLRAYDYTTRGNLVAVVTNGTAVLGLGNLGPAASKPVMEGKAVLFKRFADIDVFDIEIDCDDPDEFVRHVKALEPGFGAIHLEDIRYPDCFEIERRLKEEMSIPVFHDDQHGSAIISAAALFNALDLSGKRLGEVRLVMSGSGAAAIACLRLYVKLGLKKENVLLCDSKGVVYQGREGLDPIKAEFAAATPARTLAEAMVGADVFVGLSVAGLVSPEMLLSMAPDPIVFALANPDPEISYEEARETRDDVIMATGRSDFPNQVNNVLGFPFLFRGALDVRATDINEDMKLAAARALADLAREDVPDSVLRAYGLERLRFGPGYLIPKPFDHRVLLRVAPAVARAAMESGAARRAIEDFELYRRRLESLLSRRLELLHGVLDQARGAPKRIVFPEGEHDKVLRAAKVLVDEGIAHPVLLARREVISPRLQELDLAEESITILEPKTSERLEHYAFHLSENRWREGVTLEGALNRLRAHDAFAAMMVKMGDADGLVAGLTRNYANAIRLPLQTIGVAGEVRRAAAAVILLLQERIFVLADTMVNIEPSAEDLAEIALVTADFARSLDIEPRVALLSFSNFGANSHPAARKVRRAAHLCREMAPDLVVDGEMQADTAVVGALLEEYFPKSLLTAPANVLIFPELQSANIASKLLWRLAGAEAIGPVLLGMARPVQILQRGMEVADVVNMSAFCVVQAQERESATP